MRSSSRWAASRRTCIILASRALANCSGSISAPTSFFTITQPWLDSARIMAMKSVPQIRLRMTIRKMYDKQMLLFGNEIILIGKLDRNLFDRLKTPDFLRCRNLAVEVAALPNDKPGFWSGLQQRHAPTAQHLQIIHCARNDNIIFVRVCGLRGELLRASMREGDIGQSERTNNSLD